MILNTLTQKTVYTSSGKKKKYVHELLDINFVTKKETTQVPTKIESKMAALLPILPALVDIGFQLTTSALKNRSKKFSAEYSKHKSYLEAGSGIIPVIEVRRTVRLQNSSEDETALLIRLMPKQVDKIKGFVYWIERIELKYSAAMATSRNNTFDYTIELKPTFLINGEKKVQEISPIVITSVGFNNKPYDEFLHRTDIIAKPDNPVMSEVFIKIIESNPAKIRAENILSMLNENKESVKTIVNIISPKEKEDDEDNGDSNGSGTIDGSAGVESNKSM